MASAWGGSWGTSWASSWGAVSGVTPTARDSGAGAGHKKRKREEWKVIPLDVWLKLHHPEESVEKQTEAVEELAEEIEEAPPSEAARVALQLSAETRRVDSLVSELKSEGRRVAGLADLLADLADYRDALLDAKRAAEKRMKEAKRKITDLDDEEALMLIIDHA